MVVVVVVVVVAALAVACAGEGRNDDNPPQTLDVGEQSEVGGSQTLSGADPSPADPAGTVYPAIPMEVADPPVIEPYPVPRPNTVSDRLRDKLIALGASRPGTELVVVRVVELRPAAMVESPGVQTCVVADGIDGVPAYEDCAYFPGSLAADHYRRVHNTLVLEVGGYYVFGLGGTQIHGAAVATPQGGMHVSRDEVVSGAEWRLVAAALAPGGGGQ